MQNKNGFTLIELLVVVGIIGILSAFSIVALGQARQKSRDAKRIADIKQLATALDIYFNNNGSYPAAITPGQAINDGVITYMSSAPSNPTPRNDGNCAGTEYVYSTQNNYTSYNIEFCLGGNIFDVASGNNKMTPSGIIAVVTVPATCGNGIVEGSEECDDGNANDTDDCLSTCVNATCGDGYIWSGNEDCDDGDLNSDDYCIDTCVLASCGDNYVWSNLGGYVESCDDGNMSGNPCTSECALDSCGDGAVQDGEECDDGNAINEDDCSNRCINKRCGDNIVQDGEECDDGNDNTHDSCSNLCQNN